MVLERFLLLLTTLALAMALPLSVIAARGFANAPFGRLLRPVPVILGGFIALNVPTILAVEMPPLYDVTASTVAIGAALYAAVQGFLLLGGYRRV